MGVATSYRESRGGGHRHDERGTDDGCLLDHLDRDAAGEQHHAGSRRHLIVRQRAAKLVERVVPPDVLAQRHHAAARFPECRRMNGTRIAIDPLQRRHAFERAHDLGRAEHLAGLYRRRDTHRFIKRLDPAQATSRRSREITPALPQRGGVRFP